MDNAESVSSLHSPDEARRPLRREMLPEDVLDGLGHRHPRLFLAVALASCSWASGVIPLMISAFIVSSHSDCHFEGREDLREHQRGCMKTLTDSFSLDDDVASLTTSAFMLGNMLGAATLSSTADRLGRRPVLLCSLLVLSLSSLAAALSPNVTLFTLARALQGASYTGSTLVAWVCGYELSPTKLRNTTALLFGVMWTVGYIAVAPLAYIASSWRQLTGMCALPPLLLFFFTWLYIPETLHHLASRGSPEKGEKWMRKINGKNADQLDIEELFVRPLARTKKSSFYHTLCKNKKFLVYCFILIVLWVSNAFIYFGLSLYSTSLAGNRYLNFVLIGLVELPAYILSPWFMSFGRRLSISLLHFAAALTFISLLVLPDAYGLQLCGWLAGKFVISTSFMSIFVYASELFPTNIRSSAVGICSVMSKIGGIGAPYMSHLSDFGPSAPAWVLFGICCVCGAITLALPETLNAPLPTTLVGEKERGEEHM